MKSKTRFTKMSLSLLLVFCILSVPIKQVAVIALNSPFIHTTLDASLFKSDFIDDDKPISK